jgi:hypothetical protein
MADVPRAFRPRDENKGGAAMAASINDLPVTLPFPRRSIMSSIMNRELAELFAKDVYTTVFRMLDGDPDVMDGMSAAKVATATEQAFLASLLEVIGEQASTRGA